MSVAEVFSFCSSTNRAGQFWDRAPSPEVPPPRLYLGAAAGRRRSGVGPRLPLPRAEHHHLHLGGGRRAVGRRRRGGAAHLLPQPSEEAAGAAPPSLRPASIARGCRLHFPALFLLRRRLASIAIPRRAPDAGLVTCAAEHVRGSTSRRSERPSLPRPFFPQPSLPQISFRLCSPTQVVESAEHRLQSPAGLPRPHGAQSGRPLEPERLPSPLRWRRLRRCAPALPRARLSAPGSRAGAARGHGRRSGGRRSDGVGRPSRARRGAAALAEPWRRR